MHGEPNNKSFEDGKENYPLSKVLKTLACTIMFMMITSFLDIVIVTGVEIWMITRVPLVLYSTWETLPSHGYQRNNQLSLFPHVKQSM